MTWIAVAELAAVEDIMMIATCSLTGESISTRDYRRGPTNARTIKRSRIDPPENALRWEGRVHGISEPIR